MLEERREAAPHHFVGGAKDLFVRPRIALVELLTEKVPHATKPDDLTLDGRAALVHRTHGAVNRQRLQVSVDNLGGSRDLVADGVQL
jgi:hypothetical protein